MAALLARTFQRQRRRLSPLTVRIMAVNMLALAILVGAILYLANYEERLIDVELQALRHEAELFAGAIAEGATMINDAEQEELLPALARQMVRRLDEVTTSRARLFMPSGVLLADSWVVGKIAATRVEHRRLPPERSFFGSIVHECSEFVRMFTPQRQHFPPYVEDAVTEPAAREEVVAALAGDEAMQVYRGPDGTLLFSVAVPVQRYKFVLGALNLTRSGQQVEEAMAGLRQDILKIFALALAITALMSLYLARALARPIHRLALAADQVRFNELNANARRREIPDFTARNDEIGDLSGALRAMTQTIWQRMEAIEKFAADVAHELKNPLASLRSAIEVLPKVPDETQRAKLLGIIEYDVKRLDRLLTDIASASRLDAELSRMELEPVAVAHMLQTLVDVYSYQEHTAGRVQLATVEENLQVQAVESRLVQVLQNLITNAISFSPPLATGKGTVRLSAQRDGVWVKVTVDDDGPGIPPAKLAAIFDRFYTERPSSEGFGEHSGLGLAISKQIIEAHRGQIYAENRMAPDGSIGGARFVILLPAKGK